MIGATIDNRYRILRRIGEGGMGAVFEAEHTGTGRRVALKIILTEKAQRPDIVARFQREARAAGAIDTPHIVAVLDTGTDRASAVVYTAMELLRGEDLRQVLVRARRLPPLVALRLAGQVCLGLGAAHAAGVIHRDIKPANVFLCDKEDGEIAVKLVDFGIAKMKADVHAQDDMALTTTGGMIGSPLYMSPEQAVGAKTIDHRSDLWSLGVVLYEALAGRPPHNAETLGALIVAISTKDVPPLQDLAPWVPPEVARLVHRLLDREPDARFPSAAALLDAVKAIVPDGLSVRASEVAGLDDEELAYVAPRAALDLDIGPSGRASAQSVTMGPQAAPNPRAPSPQLDTESRSKLALTRTIEAGPGEATSDRRPAAPRSAPEPRPSSSGHAVSGENGLAVSQVLGAAPARPGRSRLVPALALAAAALGAAGLVVYLRGAPRAEGAPQSAAPAETAPPAAFSSQAAAPVPPPPAPEERTVRVAVEPAGVAVEVDGRPAPVNGGAVELRGTLGSIHRVVITRGAQEERQAVVITEEGPHPAVLRLPPPAASAAAAPGAGRRAVPRPPSPLQPPPPSTVTAAPMDPKNLPPAPTFE